MCVVNKYANIYLQKVYTAMSCLCIGLKLTIVDQKDQLITLITSEKEDAVRPVLSVAVVVVVIVVVVVESDVSVHYINSSVISDL